MTTEEKVFANEVRQMLDERFGDEFKFGPIEVWADQDDDISFLRTYIVFEGDVHKLEPAKTLPMERYLWTRATELGYPGVPLHSYVLKSEWPSLSRALKKAWGPSTACCAPDRVPARLGITDFPGGVMTTEEKVFANEVRQMLDERFGDEFKFGPIEVWADQDDDISFLRTYIVFEGDMNKLDPAKTMSMKRHLWTRATELGYPGVPLYSYVLKSEWPGLLRALQKAWA
jgi:hypothetical protein